MLVECSWNLVRIGDRNRKKSEEAAGFDPCNLWIPSRLTQHQHSHRVIVYLRLQSVGCVAPSLSVVVLKGHGQQLV